MTSPQTFLLLVALVTGVDGSTISLDKGLAAGLRPGDEGEVFYELEIANETRRIEVGRGRIVDADEGTARLRLSGKKEVRLGYRVRFELSTERLVEDLRRRAVRAEAPSGAGEVGPLDCGRCRDAELVVRETIGSCLNVRREARLEAPPLACVAPGTALASLGLVEGEWRKLRLPDGREGWAASAFLRGDAAPERQTGADADVQAALAEKSSEVDALRRELKESRVAASRTEKELRERLDLAEAQSLQLDAELAAVEQERAPDLDRRLAAALSRVAVLEGELTAERARSAAPESAPAPRALKANPTAESGAAEAAAAVREWAAAWSGQRIEDYLASYATVFRPPNGLERSAWEAQRRARLAAPSSIEVRIGDLSIDLVEGGRARASFLQAYCSDTYADEVRKTLELVREDTDWKIASERSD